MENRTVNLACCASLLAFLFVGCDQSDSDRQPIADTINNTPSPTQFKVEQVGEMREVMRQGKTQARISLVEATDKPGAIAVGALQGLTGEITIVDGETWVARVDAHNELVLTGPEPNSTDGATLLTLGHVEDWAQTEIKESVEGRELEKVIEEFAQTRGIDTTQPFPFRIEGTINRISIHVINGYCPIATDPDTQDKKPWRWSANEPVLVNIIGFYAPNKVAVMTHHGTSIHAHAILQTGETRLAGHIDQAVIEPGMVLRVPHR